MPRIAAPERIRPDLHGVAETLLWPLWHRAAYAAGPLAILPDPLAVDLLGRIDYPFRAHFGAPRPWHALRARWGDGLIRRHLTRWPEATVVSLGEGLETQFWRVAQGAGMRWISVELPEVIALRRRLLPFDPRLHEVAGSATDGAWMDAVDARPPPFVQAAGLLMYLEGREVERLIVRTFARYPDATLAFDTIPPEFSRKTLEGLWVTSHYRAPPMPWGIAHDAISTFVKRLVPDARVRVRTYADTAPWMAPWGWCATLVPAFRNRIAPCLVTVEGAAREA